MWTTIFKIRVAENPRLTCLKLLLTSVMMQWSANVTMYSSSEIPMQSCLCSKSCDLYSRKDKSNIICWETIIITLMINLTSNKVILLSQNILSGCDCETCCPGDLVLYSTRGRFNVLTPTYLPDLIHLNNSIVVK